MSLKNKQKYNEAAILEEIQAYIEKTYSEHYGNEKLIQVTELAIDKGPDIAAGFFMLTIMKYADRYGKKDGFNRKDIMKIIHYAIFELYNHDLRTGKIKRQRPVENVDKDVEHLLKSKELSEKFKETSKDKLFKDWPITQPITFVPPMFPHYPPPWIHPLKYGDHPWTVPQWVPHEGPTCVKYSIKPHTTCDSTLTMTNNKKDGVK